MGDDRVKKLAELR